MVAPLVPFSGASVPALPVSTQLTSFHFLFQKLTLPSLPLGHSPFKLHVQDPIKELIKPAVRSGSFSQIEVVLLQAPRATRDSRACLPSSRSNLLH